MSEDKLTLRTLKTGAVAATTVTVAMAASGHGGPGVGFLIGSTLSLSSLFSLTFLVPFLLRPGAPRYAGSLLGLTLVMKLPLYVVGLYAATHLPGVSAVWAACGIALAPVIITLKTIGEMMPKPARVSGMPHAGLETARRAMREEANSFPAPCASRPFETKGSTVFHPQAQIATASERG